MMFHGHNPITLLQIKKHMKADENKDILTVNFVKPLVTSYIKSFFSVSFSLGSIWNLTKNNTKLVNHFKVLTTGIEDRELSLAVAAHRWIPKGLHC